MVRRIIRISNYFFAAAMPFSHIGGYLAAAVGIFRGAGFWKRVRREPLFLALSAFLLYGFFRNVFAAERAVGFAAMAGYLSHWMLPFLLGYGLGEPSAVKNALKTWCFVMAGLVVVSTLAYAGIFPARLAPGFVLAEEGLLKALRSHISLGALVLLLSFLSLGQALDKENTGKGRRAAFLALAVFFLGALLLTGSRGYYIAAALSYALFGTAWAVRTGNWKYPAAAGTVLAGMALLLTILSPGVRARIDRTGPADDNIQERVALYRVALWEIEASPLFGFGPGQGIRQAGFFDRLPEARRNVGRHPALHSFYLNFAADFGLAGIALLLVVLYALLKDPAAHLLPGSGFRAALSFGIFWGVAGILIGEMFDTLLRGPGVAMEVFWLAGMLAGLNDRTGKEDR